MRRWWWALVLTLVLAGCKSGGETDQASGDEEEQSSGQPSDDDDGEGTAAPNQRTPPSNEQPAGEPFEGRRDDHFVTERFNVRFTLPAEWTLAEAQTADSLSFDGPSGIQMIVANSESIQLVDTNFTQLNDRVSFEAVNILPERSQHRPLNGLPGYRVEGDALLRGEDLPVYFVSQAINVPGEPVMVTVFVPGDNYFEESETIMAVLDSIEALNLRPN